MMVKIMWKLKILILSVVLVPSLVWGQVRLKDISDIQGCADFQVIGYGLVVGLDRTGDGIKSEFTIQSIVNMLERFGLNVDPKKIKPKNVAAVIVTAELSPFAKPGSRIDVVVSSFGDANSLQGGMLLVTPLLGLDGEIYIQAQGPLSIGGFNVGMEGGAGVRENHALVGRIPGGGFTIKPSPIRMKNDGIVTFLLYNPDFTTATRIAQAINRQFEQPIALVIDAGTVEARVPPDMGSVNVKMDFIAKVESTLVIPDVPARVVINERTGTIVVGLDVRLSKVAISHGNLSITITPQTKVFQPPPLSLGQTVIDTTAQIEVRSSESHLMVVEETPDVGSVAEALNALGVKPRDVVAIFQALKQAGALQAELIII